MLYKKYFKQCLDVLISILTLIVLSPILGVLTIILSIHFKGNPFFCQNRPGKNSSIFKLIKFKTMTDERDTNGNLLPDVARLTKISKIIRRSSLDEIPQLINVLKGDMSLIGPRPLLVSYLPLYTQEQSRRHEVRPGITGWAQVNGRNLMRLSKKFELDVWYVDNCSFLLDCRILFMTFINVLSSKDVGLGAGDMKQVDDLNFESRINNM